MSSVEVRVPATSANLGPGFDALGLALGLHNTVRMTATESDVRVEIKGEGVDTLPTGPDNLIVRAAGSVFTQVGERPAGLLVEADNHIPLDAGLGSSAAAIVSGMFAANALLDWPLTHERVLRLAIEMEGHPDNVAAAVLGGLTISTVAGGDLVSHHVSVRAMRAVVVLPPIRVPTHEARQALPTHIPLGLAAIHIGRAALVIEALRTGDLRLLGQAMEDQLHVPTRSRYITGYDHVIQAARDSGAVAITISGAGPALIAFAARDHDQVAGAMAAAFQTATGKRARWWVLPVDNEGVSVV